MVYLNFHGVGPRTRDMDAGEFNCWLEQDVFESVLDLVQNKTWVRLTVDDGNASDHAIVLPALLKRNLKATFFICSERLDQPTFLSHMQVLELQSQGMLIGSHGAAHVPWRKLNPGQLHHELADSRRALEDLCGRPVDEAACPFGSYGRRALAGLRSAGYRTVYTSDGGGATEEQWLRARNTVTRLTLFENLRRLVDAEPAGIGQAVINLRKFMKQMRA